MGTEHDAQAAALTHWQFQPRPSWPVLKLRSSRHLRIVGTGCVDESRGKFWGVIFPEEVWSALPVARRLQRSINLASQGT